MFNANSIVIQSFSQHVLERFQNLFSQATASQLASLEQAVTTALETLLHCDCPYHDVPHTILVTDVGLSILQGRQIMRGDLTSDDALQAIVAMLFHDIGYIRQLLPEDNSEQSLVDQGPAFFVSPPAGASDAYMAPYHVKRGTLYIADRFSDDAAIDPVRVAECIEMTRFPVPAADAYQTTDSLPALVRAADLIGQMADPEYQQICGPRSGRAHV